MTNTLQQSIGQFAALHPEALCILDRHGVDYCCGGKRTFEESCTEANVNPRVVLEEIEQATSEQASTTNWLMASLASFCDHIEQTHHQFLRQQLPFITRLLDKVVTAHGEAHPELVAAKKVFSELRAELEPHMFKEEQVLFPAIRRLEKADGPLSMPFGSMENPVRVMEDEHASAGQALRQLCELTESYRVPEGACTSYRALLELLQRLELDLHEHIHKENNILFPRALVLEEQHNRTS